MISALRQKSKFEFRTFLKFFGFHVVVLVKNFPLMYQIIINYQCRADIDEAKVISAFRQKSKFEFRTFLKKKSIFWVSDCSTREDFSIDVSITNVGLILTKLRLFQLFVKSQNSNFELFWKKFKFFGFHGAVLVKIFPLMYQLLM